MQPQPRSHAVRTAAARRGFAAALALFALVGAIPADADTPREITNIAEVSHTIGDSDQRFTVTAEATIEIARPPVQGDLRLMQLNCTLNCDAGERHRFDGGAFSTSGTADGPFQPLPAPYNHATVHGTRGAVDTSAPVEVVEADILPLGAPVFAVLKSPDLNADPQRAETALVTLRDAITGDIELLRLRETGPDTGVFTAAVEAVEPPPAHGDGRISTAGMSTITARYTDPLHPDNTLEAEIDVGPFDPHGVVYDMATSAPVDGVRITLINDETGAPARVLGDDLRSDYPATLTSGGTVTDAAGNSYEMAPGGYRFPFVRPGTYRFEIEAPEGYLPAQLDFQPAERGGRFAASEVNRVFAAGPAQDRTHHDASDPFTIRPQDALNINIALARAEILSVVRNADTDTADTGGFVEFQIEVTASTEGVVTLIDTLPDQLRFLPGTLRIDGQPVTPAVSDDGRRLRITDRQIRTATPLEMTYTAQVNVAARPGDRLRSRTEANGTMPEADDTHTLTVSDSFAMDSIAILGQVVAGPCGGAGDYRDLSGIRIYTETGEYAVTDAQGRFSFRDMARRPTVVQLDELTLPPGARPVLCQNNTRRAGSAISQFVDVRPGLMGRASFQILFDDPGAAESDDADTVETAWRSPVEDDPVSTYTAEWLNGQPLDAAPRILFPPHGHQADRRAVNLFYLRPADARVEVRVNGETVDARRRDPATRNLLGTTALDRWRGLPISQGRNTISVTLTAPDGSRIARHTHDVMLAGPPAQAELLEKTSQLDTDGRTNPVIEMRVTDRNGIPVRPGTRISVRTAAPFAFAPERSQRGAPASDKAPSTTTQAKVGTDGVIRLVMAPTMETATADITIPVTDGRDIEKRVRISAADRPWMLVGIAEGTLAERHIRRHMRAADGNGAPDTGRVALFAEGVIRGEYLLTLRYDSARDGSGDFHGIDPDTDYIVYGDASYQGDAAQSRFPLFLRIRRDGAEFLIGDFDTGINSELLNYNRRMTGARAEMAGDGYRISAFGARTDDRRIEDRFAADGTIGPFDLTGRRIVQHSETVRVVTVSRRDATRELRSERLVAGVDYVLDRRSGTLRLRRAVPAFTPDLDRNVVVIEYETADTARSGTIVGARAEADVTDRLSAAATVLDARRVDGSDIDTRIIAVEGSYDVTDNLRVSAEALRADKSGTASAGAGHAGVLRLDYDSSGTSLHAHLRRQRGNVAPDAQTRDADFTSAGLEFASRLGRPAPHAAADTGVFVEGRLLHEEDGLTGQQRTDGEVLMVRRDDRLRQGGGIRVVREDIDGETSTAAKALGRIGWASPDGRLDLQIDSEQTVMRDGPAPADDLTELRLRYAVSDSLSAFGTYKTALRDGQGAGSFGLETTPWAGVKMHGGLARAENGTATGHGAFVGLDQSLKPREGLALSLGLDVQHDLGATDVPLAGDLGNPLIEDSFVTLRAGARKTTESWSAGIDVEARHSDNDVTANLRVSGDGRLGEDWTVGGAAFIGQTRPRGAAARSDLDVTVSAAHRGDADAPVTLLQARLKSATVGDNDRVTGIGSIYHARDLTEADSLNMRYGIKYVESRDTAGRHRDILNFIGGEYRRDVHDKFDIGLHGAAMHSGHSGSVDASLGMSVGFTPFENGWMSVGYNVRGFRDGDFSENGHTGHGAFMQFRMKFDQHSIRKLFR